MWRVPLAHALLLSAAVSPSASSGDPRCPCLEAVDLQRYRRGASVIYTPEGTADEYRYPGNYGVGTCQAHDQGLPPRCNSSEAPGWCATTWCYVDVHNCHESVHRTATSYFPGVPDLTFSYATCNDDTRSEEAWQQEDVEATRRILDLIQDYSAATRLQLETTYGRLSEDQPCDTVGMCPCTSRHGRCWEAPGWGNNISFSDVGTKYPANTSADHGNLSSCLSADIAETYSRIGSQESDTDFTKVGYQYFADHPTGTYTQWPNMDFCSPDYDPRLRPWYAAGATGPKDVVIVVDVSGSMAVNGRSELALAATLALLDTLTWKDHATIILFNNRVEYEYSDRMVPVTEQERALMKRWCQDKRWARGGTNFHASLKTRAFDIISASVAEGKTSMCQKAVMFLTDGKPTENFTEADYATIRQLSERYDVIPFTYALGAEADTATTKRLACENGGVFYRVPDGTDLKSVMTKYYAYFAAGQEICTTNYVKYLGYGTGGLDLYAGCTPMYDRTTNWPKLLGVTCTDVNLITLVDDLAAESSWDFFVCQSSDVTKMCQPLYLHECHRQRIRRDYSEESVCQEHEYAAVEDSATCPCVSQGCQDDTAWTDEQGYYCDTWVGDSCHNAVEEWGYTEEGKAEVLRRCRRSCGLCEWAENCPYATSPECPVVDMPARCRKCSGRTSGVDIEGNSMGTCSGSCPVGSWGHDHCPSTTTQPASGSSLAARQGLGSLLVVWAAAMVWVLVSE